jgi:hypothetical protein
MNNSTELEKIASLKFEDLVLYINELIAKDFSKLVHLLYAVDVPEKKLKSLLDKHPNEDAGKLIALLMIERQEQKRKSREEFKQKEADIPDEDRW